MASDAPSSIAIERADGRAAGHTEHERIGQRVAEHGLQEHAREREQTADAECRERAWQAQLEQHGARHRVGGIAERAQETLRDLPARSPRAARP